MDYKLLGLKILKLKGLIQIGKWLIKICKKR